jgi:hypothetical protein
MVGVLDTVRRVDSCPRSYLACTGIVMSVILSVVQG